MIDILFLIISSNDNPIYEEFKKLQRLYLNLPIDPEYRIKYFFIEFKLDIDNQNHPTVMEVNDIIYIQGEESINPGMILKTCKAIEHVYNNYNYDFLIRTNLSTMFNLSNLFEYLRLLPKENACGGFNYRTFITGTGIILSRDVSKIILDNFLRYNIYTHNEDIIISAVLNKFKTPYYNPKHFFKWGIIVEDENIECGEYEYFLTNGKFKELDLPNNILHFRIKNVADRELDIIYFKYLIEKLYGVKIIKV
jgi:hypothetical protein